MRLLFGHLQRSESDVIFACANTALAFFALRLVLQLKATIKSYACNHPKGDFWGDF